MHACTKTRQNPTIHVNYFFLKEILKLHLFPFFYPLQKIYEKTFFVLNFLFYDFIMAFDCVEFRVFSPSTLYNNFGQ